MTPFYNRDPWNLIIGFGSLAVIVFALAAATSWWLLLALPALIASVYIWQQVVRTFALVTYGYHSQWVGNGKLRYEEISASKRRAFTLNLENTEPGHYELFVPDEGDWVKLVPNWAEQRRIEIAERIAKTWRRADVHIK